jgi:hypothetical protein
VGAAGNAGGTLLPGAMRRGALVLALAGLGASGALAPVCSDPPPQGTCVRDLYAIGSAARLVTDLGNVSALYNEQGVSDALREMEADPADEIVVAKVHIGQWAPGGVVKFGDPRYVGSKCARDTGPWNCPDTGLAFSLPLGYEALADGELGEDGSWKVLELRKFITYGCLKQNGCTAGRSGTCLVGALERAFEGCEDTCATGRGEESFQPDQCDACLSDQRPTSPKYWAAYDEDVQSANWTCVTTKP